MAEAAAIGAAVAAALTAAHANGVVHRDVKPGNVMLTPTGVKILDFGISAVTGEPDDDDTGATFGTPAYVAPERLDGKPAEPATDVYGLGVLLYEMVTGQPPYPVDTWEELARARAGGAAVLPATLPAAFRELVDRCLVDEPDRRPTAVEAGDALADLAAPEEADQRTPATVAGPRVPGERVGQQALGGGTGRGSPGIGSRTGSGTGTGSRSGGAGQPASGAVVAGRAASDSGPAGQAASGFRPAGQAASGSRPAGQAASGSGVVAEPGFGGAAGAGSTAVVAPGRPEWSPDGGRGRGPAHREGGRAGSGRRRLVLWSSLVALVVSVLALFAALGTSRQTIEAGPSPAATPPPASPRPSASPRASATATVPATPRAAATTAAPLDVDVALARVRSAIEAGRAARQIRPDVAVDLLNLLRPLSRANGRAAEEQAAELRRKVDDRVTEGSVDAARAAVLRSRLDDLDEALGSS
ncbi:serine/threonine-protein kinase [Actinoplanes nipponensis]|uniref:serine/threonine-protein kinase n=1 Tax=Actinoplanes nipponensis TaxID=135950 RepID=UPI0031ECC80B